MLYRVHEVRVVSEDFKLKFNSYCLKADGNSMVIASGGPNIQDLVRNFSEEAREYLEHYRKRMSLPLDFYDMEIGTISDPHTLDLKSMSFQTEGINPLKIPDFSKDCVVSINAVSETDRLALHIGLRNALASLEAKLKKDVA